MSPLSPIDNKDIDEICRHELLETESAEINKIDVIYNNGMDENRDVEAKRDYRITRKKLERLGFKGKVMHLLPRKKEMGICLDNTKYKFQSVFWNQLNGRSYA